MSAALVSMFVAFFFCKQHEKSLTVLKSCCFQFSFQLVRMTEKEIKHMYEKRSDFQPLYLRKNFYFTSTATQRDKNVCRIKICTSGKKFLHQHH